MISFIEGSFYQSHEEGMRLIRSALKLRMILDADEESVVSIFNCLYQKSVRG